MVWYEEHGENAALTCRHFGISRDTFYRWRRRFLEFGPAGLEDGSHGPKNVRKPTWFKELEDAVLELRRLTPGWGKDKLVVLLGQQGWRCSTSMVGRILRHLKESGRLVEAPGADPWMPRRSFQRPYGVRKPKEYLADRPGAIGPGGHRLCDTLPRLQFQALHCLRRLHPLAGPGGTRPRHGSRRGRLSEYDP